MTIGSRRKSEGTLVSSKGSTRELAEGLELEKKYLELLRVKEARKGNDLSRNSELSSIHE